MKEIRVEHTPSCAYLNGLGSRIRHAPLRPCDLCPVLTRMVF